MVTSGDDQGEPQRSDSLQKHYEMYNYLKYIYKKNYVNKIQKMFYQGHDLYIYIYIYIYCIELPPHCKTPPHATGAIIGSTI